MRIFTSFMEDSGTKISELDYYAGKLDSEFESDDIIWRGNINLIRKLKAKSCKNIWIGDEFLWSSYSKYLNLILLNSSSRQLTIEELNSNWDKCFNGRDRLFVRPDRYDKIFPGTVINSNDRAGWLEMLRFWQIETTEHVIYCSNWQNIRSEYRFVCTPTEVIGQCQYMESGEIKIDSKVPTEAKYYLEYINKNFVSKIIPYPAYVIDIALTTGYHVIELNAFNTSGLYSINLLELVSKL